jgi:GGDEF domain-containing protein
MNILAQHPKTTEELLQLIIAQQNKIASLCWNDELSMLSQAGLMDAIHELPEGRYVVVFCDIDRLKTLNTITGSHIQTNRYLRDGLRVRRGELAGQFLGDEFVFVLADGSDAAAFCARISRQLADQPLSDAERAALVAIAGPGARLSATFASAVVGRDGIHEALSDLSKDVLAQKARRDRRA